MRCGLGGGGGATAAAALRLRLRLRDGCGCGRADVGACVLSGADDNVPCMGDARGAGADPLPTATPSEFVLPQPRSAREHVGDAEPMILGLVPEPEQEPEAPESRVDPDHAPEPTQEPAPESGTEPEVEPEPAVEPGPAVGSASAPAPVSGPDPVVDSDQPVDADRTAEWVESLFEEEAPSGTGHPAEAEPLEQAAASTSASHAQEPQPAAQRPQAYDHQSQVHAEQPSYEQQSRGYEPQPQPQAGAWWPDYSGRFEHRWHDGVAWTAYVSTQGAVYTDPFGV